MMQINGAFWSAADPGDGGPESSPAPATIRFSHVQENEMGVETEIVVSGVTPAGYNGTYVVYSCTRFTCQVLQSVDPGEYVSGGTIT